MAELPPFTLGLNQEATYWPPGEPDGTGGLTASTPVNIDCRWLHDAKLFRAPDGQEVVSQAVVFVDRVLQIKGRLAPGRNANLDDSLEIRQVAHSPTVDATRQRNKVYL